MSDLTISDFTAALFSTLKEMDEESPYGLRGYSGYVNERDRVGEIKNRDEIEVSITTELADKLLGSGIPAFAEAYYPRYAAKSIGKKNPRCDIVAVLDGRQSVWVEVKPYYRLYWNSDFTEKQRGSTKFIQHLGDDCEKKLRHLRAPYARFVGALLIGFETEEEPTDVNFVQQKLGSRLVGWQAGHDEETGVTWSTDLSMAPPELHFVTRCWFWWRAVEQ